MSTAKQDSNAQVRQNNLRQVQAQQQDTPAARLPVAFNGRWTRRQWAHASLFATLGALLAALVPGFSGALEAPHRSQSMSMSLQLPSLPAARVLGEAGDSWQIVNVRRGQTLSHVLDEMGVAREQRAALLAHPLVRANLVRLKPGTELAFDLPVGGALRTLRFDRGDAERIELSFNDGELVENIIQRPVETRTVVLSGEVGKSLHLSARAAGLSNAAIKTLTDEIFKYDIDFRSDVTASDRFSVVVEQRWREGQLIGTGPVLAATFSVGDKLHSGFRFERNGKPEYFTADGKSLKKPFIRMPIPYARLTSNFGKRRHPVLGGTRQHRGVDYAAATGTPIQAAGDARVASVGWQGGYGRTVVLDHGRGHTTLYAHMSRFGNIRPGQRISQGTVIGYVGSSGMSTGPHLHYEFRVNGVHRNPLSVTLPPPAPLSGAALAEFRSYTRDALARIREVENIIYQDPDETRVADGGAGTAQTAGARSRG